ncbi:MAG: P1 family peptidase [Desulfomonile sp.]|nr:P1 family peptidase [Desulfomonile sp.]
MSDPSNLVHDDITDVPGVRVGHAQDFIAKTGVTVILPPPDRTTAGIYIGGNASSTRQMDSLKPMHIVDRIHGLCLAGGSAFGLDAGGGVMTWLERNGIGLQVTGKVIPIVPAAVIFDLNFGDGSVRPGHELGYQACEAATDGAIAQGSVGAGTGATVGKLFGIDQAMKGGLGSASLLQEDLIVGALVVVNAYGDVHNGDVIVAGVRESPESPRTADAARLLAAGKAISRTVSVENTTLAVVAVNARLDKVTAGRIAAQATLGLAAAIKPFHTHIDGDLTVVMGVGDQPADPNRIGLLAAEVLTKAVVSAVKLADGFGLLPAYKDIHPHSI